MGLLDIHADAMATAAVNTPRIDPPAPQPKFSLWRTTTAVPRGATTAAAESGGFAADMLGAFGQVLGAYPEAMGPVQLTPEQRRQAGEARTKLLTEGIDYSSEAGGLLRGAGDTYRPDPVTAHTAERLVFDFSRFATKAIGYSVAGGPVLGAAMTAADEGMTAAEQLRQQGVDEGTRTAAGAVAGVAAGLGVALPVAGRTALQTAGLVALGGPLSFMGQQEASRYILANAGYDKIAGQYDPFDPVGLAVATLVPAGFGAYAMRGARRAAAAREAGAVPAAEPGRPAAEGAPRPGEPVPAQPPRVEPTLEQVDAARVSLIRETVDSWNLGSAADARAAAAHLEAFARAQDQLASGQRVEVAGLVPVERANVAVAMDRMITSLQSARDDLMATAADLAEPGAVRAMRDELAQLQAAQVDTSPEAIRALAKEIQAADGVSYKTALSKARKVIDEQAAQQDARITRLEDAIGRNAEAQQALQELQQLDQGITRLQTERAQVDAPQGAAPTPVAAAARQLVDDVARGVAQATGLPPAEVAQAMSRALDGQAVPADAAPPVRTAEPSAAPASAGQPDAGPGTSGGSPEAQRLAQVLDQFPDLMVRVDGMDQPMPARQLLEAIRAEADGEVREAPLLQVAVNCALSLGV